MSRDWRLGGHTVRQLNCEVKSAPADEKYDIEKALIRMTLPKPAAVPPSVVTPSQNLPDGPAAAKAKNQNIHVSPAVLDAARKDGEELLQSLRTTATGLTQAEAEEQARARRVRMRWRKNSSKAGRSAF